MSESPPSGGGSSGMPWDTIVSAIETPILAKQQADTQSNIAEMQADTANNAAAKSYKATMNQLFFQANESAKKTLIDILQSKQQNRPVLTLGATPAPVSWLDKINAKIHSILTGG